MSRKNSGFAADLAAGIDLSEEPLPSKCPELNPVENVWQFMRDNWLSNRIFRSYDDILDHCYRLEPPRRSTLAHHVD